ncbi:MAG: hypothetical protein R6V27_06050 [Balneolaceae bacterium]
MIGKPWRSWRPWQLSNRNVALAGGTAEGAERRKGELNAMIGKPWRSWRPWRLSNRNVALAGGTAEDTERRKGSRIQDR